MQTIYFIVHCATMEDQNKWAVTKLWCKNELIGISFLRHAHVKRNSGQSTDFMTCFCQNVAEMFFKV